MIYRVSSTIPGSGGKYETECDVEATNAHEAYTLFFQEFYRDPGRCYAVEPLFCGKCGWRKVAGVDKCLGGYIPGVAHACCGHGDIELAYVVGWDNCIPGESCVLKEFSSGYFNLRGGDAIEFLEKHKIGGSNG